MNKDVEGNFTEIEQQETLRNSFKVPVCYDCKTQICGVCDSGYWKCKNNNAKEDFMEPEQTFTCSQED